MSVVRSQTFVTTKIACDEQIKQLIDIINPTCYGGWGGGQIFATVSQPAMTKS